MIPVVLGIDIGGTNTVYGLIGEEGKIYHVDQILTRGHKGVTYLLSHLKKRVSDELKNHGEYQLKGIGIGAPNGNHYSGIIKDPPNLKWGNVDIVNLFQEIFSCDVKLTNDANAGAMGEKRYGIAKKMNDFVFITLGTGLGSGIYSGGQIIYGHDSMAGEIGHISIDLNGRLCTCGLKGCLEMYVSKKGMEQTILKFQESHPNDEFLKTLNDPCDG